MEEVSLQAIKRAMPGHGRARINEKLLSILEIEDQAEVEVSTEEGKTMTLVVFSDDIVKEDTIRISSDDLVKLGIPDGGKVTVKRKVHLDEKVKMAAGSAAEHIKGGASAIGASVSGAAASIKEKLPFGKSSHDIADAMSVLSAEDATKINDTLTGAEGASAAIPVKAAAGKAIGAIGIAPELKLVALQRESKLLEFNTNTVLNEGDIIYINGPSEIIDTTSKVLEG